MPLRRGKAFTGPATAQRPRKRSAHDLCEGCNHFRSEHTSGNDCHHNGCECQTMVWTPPLQVGYRKPRTEITDEMKLRMETLLKSGMNYRKVAATIGCSPTTVKRYFPDYGDNGRADSQAHREVFKALVSRSITREKARKERGQ